MKNELEVEKAKMLEDKVFGAILRMVCEDEELALPVIKALSYLPETNEKMFTLAQGLHGIGRIHALPYLEADTDEKRTWVLEHGVDNSYDPCLNAIASSICLGDLTELIKSAKTYGLAARMVEKMLEDEMILELDEGMDILRVFARSSQEHAREGWQWLASLKAAWLVQEHGGKIDWSISFPLHFLHDNETFKMALDLGMDVQDEMLDRIASDYAQNSELFELLDPARLACAKAIVDKDKDQEATVSMLLARGVLERSVTAG